MGAGAAVAAFAWYRPRMGRSTPPDTDSARDDAPSEDRIDETLAESFPASDPPPWPAGRNHSPDTATERTMATAKAETEWTGTLRRAPAG